MESGRLFGRTFPKNSRVLLLTTRQPLDFTLLDRHFGKIFEWRAAVTEIHSRGMYVILDNTMSTQANLLKDSCLCPG